MAHLRFARFAWGVLAFNLAVIVWGAFVRATGSGAGCGQHWPTCQGELLPRSPEAATLIEFTHRLTSGLAFLLVVALLIWAFRIYDQGGPVRKAAVYAMAFMVIEALVGAWLVLAGLVADNASIARAWIMSAHLINTFLLLGALTLTAWLASGGPVFKLSGQGGVGFILGAGILGMMLLGVSGAITALGDTLFQAESLADGLRQDLADGSHLFVRLRVLHPVIAVLEGVVLLAAAVAASVLRPGPNVRRLSVILGVIFVVQLAAGLINLVLLAPVWMQLVHLLIADLVWITLVLLTSTAFSHPVRQPSLSARARRLEPRAESPASSVRAPLPQ